MFCTNCGKKILVVIVIIVALAFGFYGIKKINEKKGKIDGDGGKKIEKKVEKTEKEEKSKYIRKKFASNGICTAIITDSGEVKITMIENEENIPDPGFESIMKKAEDWENVVDIGTGFGYIAGLTDDGRIHVVGENEEMNFDNIEDNWTDIAQISCSGYSIAAVKKDGTVLIDGLVTENADVSDWNNIIQVSVATYHVAAVRENGTVVASGKNPDQEYMNDDYDPERFLRTEDWKNVVQVGVNELSTVAITKDGKVLTTEEKNDFADVDNAVKICADFYWCAVVLDDGTIKEDSWLSGIIGDTIPTWTEITELDGSLYYIAGLTKDGKVRSLQTGNGGFVSFADGKITDEYRKVLENMENGNL